ncbi:SulP family inorganic anion transporter [Phytomonospora endophytica]|uniref:SulP family sulfate permease n=1 Tax=Phytomonospora endophytica TaxID=714109 RepID=A0A841FN46_9ACTN|nr:SulP family inorganic anion transporter [Phytomonospora endophytica]MBB6036323.1 SulP family sulfate permease [Phytomonospora endophytica]GIG67230.1 sodium-independent anion transporter [Phytomonospora endophytica]
MSAAVPPSPTFRSRVRTAWWSSPRHDLTAGLLVALALIPEAISFSIIAGVDPRVGLFASFTMAVTIAFTGGRPAMISAATGAMALVAAPLVRSHGVEFLLAATVLAGVVQILLGAFGVARLMRFVPRSVLTGSVNSLAALTFIAQLPHLIGKGWQVWALVAVGLAMILGLRRVPYLAKYVPAPLLTVVALTVFTVVTATAVPTVGDMGALPDSLPLPVLPNVPFTLDTLGVIAPYALTLAAVGLLESLLTAQLVDDATDTDSPKGREARGQGIANIVTGFLGGMAGCAILGQTMVNVKSGARTRLSTLAAGVFLLTLVVALGDVVARIPMAALVAVMIFVSAMTFDWTSIAPRTLRRMPLGETAVMLLTLTVVVATHNLALGVLAGVVVSAVVFARRVAHLVEVTGVLDPEGGQRVYAVTGELFFASTNELLAAFDYTGDPPKVVIDLSGAHIWDASAVAVLDDVVGKYARHGVDAEIVGLNGPSGRIHGRLSGRVSGAH